MEVEEEEEEEAGIARIEAVMAIETIQVEEWKRIERNDGLQGDLVLRKTASRRKEAMQQFHMILEAAENRNQPLKEHSTVGR